MLSHLRKIWPALLLLAACSHASAADHRVTINGISFSPANVTVAQGDTVTFVNPGGAPHNAHAGNFFRCAKGCDGAGGDGAPSADAWTATVTIDAAPGTDIDYECDVHASMGMVGTIHVQAADGGGGGTTNVPITDAFTGAWYDPTQSGHGILVEVLPNNQLLAFWFTFNPDGTQQSWFGNVGSIDPATHAASVAALQTQGGQWIPNFDPTHVTQPPWGTLTFTFTDCNHGRVDFTSGVPGYGTGHMDLTRLTQPAGLTCQ